jgi:protein tyrosine phosphatase
VVPVEATRVKVGQGRYINANYVSANGRVYIATQGPLAETTAAFWQMVMEHESRVIVMLCNLIERNKVRL